MVGRLSHTLRPVKGCAKALLNQQILVQMATVRDPPYLLGCVTGAARGIHLAQEHLFSEARLLRESPWHCLPPPPFQEEEPGTAGSRRKSPRARFSFQASSRV